jgi:copper(I)-binding protein
MHMRVFFLLLALSSLPTAWAQTPQAQATNAWIRATVAGQQVTGAFMNLHSTASLRLVEVRSPLAAVAEIHATQVDDKGVMRMRAIPWLDVPAGKVTELKPGGYHIMLMQLKTPAKAGQRTTLTLVLEDAARQRQEVAVDAEIRALNTSMPPAPHDGHAK